MQRRNRVIGLAAALVLAAELTASTSLSAATAQDVARQDTAEGARRAFAIVRELERVAAERAFWPGFDPLSVPLAIYAGGRTYLFRHPSPPEGFAPLAGAEPATSVFEGRHPAMIANTSMDIGGVTTATLLADDGSAEPPDARALAAVAVHEAFHVFQRRRHPGWRANEANLLTYPTDDAGLLALRRRESAALRRALAAADGADDATAACWTRLALEARPGDTGRCGFDSGEAAEIERVARDDVAALVARRAERRKAFDARDGWRVVVEPASGQPLWQRGFDPINLEHVDGGLLHTRFLRLANDSGELEAIDGAGADVEMLTEPAGPHPLFAGIARVTVAGLTQRPEVSDDGGRTVIRAPGFTASLRDADVEERGRVLVVRLR